MKKTLTAIVFALCASFAFAQTNNAVVKKGVVKNAAPTHVKLDASQATQQGSYKGSIFTKAAGDTISVFTFATAPTTGTLNATSQVYYGDSLATVANDAHAQSGRGATWNRLNNVAPSNYENDYPVAAGRNFASSVNLGACYSNTVDDGYMFMAMSEQIAAWGGTGTVGNYNAYFQIGPIATTGALTVEMVMYQRYRKFNYDQCWIDYSSDGTTWHAIEINVKNVDVRVNDNIHAWSRFSLPLACSDQAAIHFRIRWSCNNNGGGAYGYWWVVDDISFNEGPQNQVEMVSNEYFEGFYHQIPQGLELPLVWNAEFINTGAENQTNVQGHLYYQATRTAQPEVLMSSANIASAPYLTDTNVLIDPLGWYENNGFGYLVDGQGNGTGLTTRAVLPTENAGRHFFYSDLTSDQWEHMYKIKDTTVDEGYRFEPADAAMYQVNPIVNSEAVWSRDNGMLTGDNYWLYGMVANTTFTSDIESEEFTGWYNKDYYALTTFVTGDVVPTDADGRPWVIKGVELVPSTHPQACAPEAVIDAALILDSNYLDDEKMYVGFNWLTTGCNGYVTTEDDLNDWVEQYTTGQGEDPAYNTIRLMFPAQPELKAKRNYRLGYGIQEDGSKFSCAAANRSGFYDQADEWHYFYNTEGLEDWGIAAPLSNLYTNLVYDATYANANQSGWHWLSWDEYPMIRMIVGPYEQLPESFINFTCENRGPLSEVYFESSELCGERITVPANATMSGYVADPGDDDGYYVDEIIVNGVSEFKNDTTDHFVNFYTGSISFSVSTGSEGTENTVVVRYVYYDSVSINTVERNVKMNLMPNPATNATTLSIEGVEGMVNLAIIDMSGRVIRATKVDAEQAQTINLAGLAKGAYFVRITNNEMSKVEKLIVR